jgi:hypothetical protein
VLTALKNPGEEYRDVSAAALVKSTDEIDLHDHVIALACAAGSACSHRRRDTGRDTPYHLLDLCRPSDGRRARRDWRRRGAQLQRRLPPCVYDERPRLPVGLAVGAADQGPRACHSARGLTGRERDLRFRGPGTEGSNPAPSTGESHKPASRRIRSARPAVTSFSVLDAFRGTTTLITSRTWTISLICSGWLRRRQRRPAALPAPAPEADQRRALSESQIREQRLAH